MRVVIDTNVFVSAALKEQSMPAMAVRVIEKRGILLKSQETEQQLLDVISRPYFAAVISPSIHEWIRQMLLRAELVTIRERIKECRDPTDDKFLDLAVTGQADFIVSGDNDLLVLNPFRNIPIVPPAAFVQGVMR